MLKYTKDSVIDLERSLGESENLTEDSKSN